MKTQNELPNVTLSGTAMSWREIFSIIRAKVFSMFTRLDVIEWNIWNITKITINSGDKVTTVWEHQPSKEA